MTSPETKEISLNRLGINSITSWARDDGVTIRSDDFKEALGLGFFSFYLLVTRSLLLKQVRRKRNNIPGFLIKG